MMNASGTLAASDRRGASRWHGLVAGILMLAFALQAVAQAPAAAGTVAPPLSAEELDKLVGPIALYPDDLVGIILPASTFPVEIVQADRYLDKRKADPKLPVDDKWDDSVKSLLNYPEVVKKMSDDLDWTTALGEAVVTDQGAVIDAVQVFRRKAQGAGNLKSDDKQVVRVEKEIVYIEPADPQVIYVPQYNPTTVVAYGVPYWGYYPTPYPSYYYPYPPGAALARGVVWGAAIGAAWGGGRYGCCGDTNINIDRNTNINRSGSVDRSGTRQAAGGSSAWKSNKQPGQVSSSAGRSASSSARAGYGSTAGAGAGAGAGRGSAQATGAGGGGGGAAGRAQSAGSVSAGGHATRSGGSGSAMSGYGSGSGRQTQMDSSRGASSRSSMSGGASRGSYGGGGGGARGGGGGGGRGGGGRR
jgi:Protein of unknown function (DUF3300)